MGIDAGFDMVPRLTKGAVDKQNWTGFIELVKEFYKNDDKVEVKPNYLLFKAGEHPKLPFEGHKFLRFSSKVSGESARGSGIRCYISVNDAGDHLGHYDWSGVNASFESYEQPDELDISTSIANYVFGRHVFEELNLPQFETQPIPGKGRGLVARFHIAKGTRILFEEPLLIIKDLYSPLELLEPGVLALVRLFSKAEQRQFLSLHNSFPGKYPFIGIAKSNAFSCGAESGRAGVYPTISLINHSCLPNAHHSWDGNYGAVHAVRTILKGEEITVSYRDGGVIAGLRKVHLKNEFGFDCTCSVCSLSPCELDASDARRVRIGRLENAINDTAQIRYNPAACLADCFLMLRVVEAEYHGNDGTLIARLYYCAFQIAISHADQARAVVFVDRAYEVRVTCDGVDSPETVTMGRLKQSPASHESFCDCSMRWETRRESLPKGLTVAEFERWLWRMEDDAPNEPLRSNLEALAIS